VIEGHGKPSRTRDIQKTLRNAMQRASLLSATSGDALFQVLAYELKNTTTSTGKAQKIATDALATYHELVQIARKSENFNEVLTAAKDHVSESLSAWSISEYEHVFIKADVDTLSSKAQQKAFERKVAKHKLNLWIIKQIKNKEQFSDYHGVLAEFFQSQIEHYSEEEETIRMLSLFSVVYRANGVKQYFDGKILCDVAHPITMRELEYKHDFIFRCLEQLNESCCALIHYIRQLEDLDFDEHEAKELLRIYTMIVWKSLRCFKLVAFTSEVMLEILQMPTFSGEDMWTHATSDQWSIGVGMRDSPVIETITIGAVVIIGLLCTPAPLSKILLTPDVFHIQRAVRMLTDFTEKHRRPQMTSTHMDK